MEKHRWNLRAVGAILAALCGGLAPSAPPDAGTKHGPFPTQAIKETNDEVRAAVQITELGCMRVLLVLDRVAMDGEKLVTQRLTDADFRVFPAAQAAAGRMTADEAKRLGKENQADLILYATVGDRKKNSMGGFALHEGEATVQIFSAVSGEVLVTHTARADGVRHANEVEAQRSAREKSLDLASRATVIKALEKAHKMLVHRAVINGIRTEDNLLAIMEHVAKMEDVCHVRRVSFDRGAQRAEIEIIGAPRSATFWRGHMEKMPAVKIVKVEYVPNREFRDKKPSWF